MPRSPHKSTAARLVAAQAILASMLSFGCGESVAPVAPDALTQPERLALPTASATDIARWRNFSQSDRDMVIFSCCLSEIGKTGPSNCKVWASGRISAASRGVTGLPATQPDASGWYYSPSKYLRAESGIHSVHTGAVIQAVYRLKNKAGVWYSTPHTMIVLTVSSTGFTVAEENWTPGKVATRTIPFTEFEGATKKVTQFTVYTILGG